MSKTNQRFNFKNRKKSGQNMRKTRRLVNVRLPRLSTIFINFLPNKEEIKKIYQHIVQQTTKRIKQSVLETCDKHEMTTRKVGDKDQKIMNFNYDQNTLSIS